VARDSFLGSGSALVYWAAEGGGCGLESQRNEGLERVFTFVLLAVWFSFFAVPFMGSTGQRSGIFVPSPEWGAYAPWAIFQGTLVGLGALLAALAITAFCIGAALRGDEEPLHPAFRRVLMVLGGTLLLCLPLWGWGFEQSFLRVWAHESAPTLADVSTEATVNSYHVTQSRRTGATPHLHLRVSEYGRLEINHHPPFKQNFEPRKGMKLEITGRRTWVGVYYDTVQWPAAWLE